LTKYAIADWKEVSIFRKFVINRGDKRANCLFWKTFKSSVEIETSEKGHLRVERLLYYKVSFYSICLSERFFEIGFFPGKELLHFS
jgi:hypothetical protein